MLHKTNASYYKVQKQKLPQKLQDILQLKSSIYKYECSLNSQNKHPKALKKNKKVIILIKHTQTHAAIPSKIVQERREWATKLRRW